VSAIRKLSPSGLYCSASLFCSIDRFTDDISQIKLWGIPGLTEDRFLDNSTNGKPKYEGVPIWMDGKEWIIPPLSLGQFRKHHDTLTNVEATPQDWQELIASRLPIILGAVQRNYPELTEEQLLDMIDLRTYNAILGAIMHSSGMRPAQPGESQPVAEMSIGAGSTGR
jgi:hypothetical protein